jgi:hypothetical protein
MNRFLNFIFVFSIPCYIWDWYDYIVNGERDVLIYVALICLTIYFIGEIPRRIILYRHFKSIWY